MDVTSYNFRFRSSTNGRKWTKSHSINEKLKAKLLQLDKFTRYSRSQTLAVNTLSPYSLSYLINHLQPAIKSARVELCEQKPGK
jgi:hypothetical protein